MRNRTTRFQANAGQHPTEVKTEVYGNTVNVRFGNSFQLTLDPKGLSDLMSLLGVAKDDMDDMDDMDEENGR